MRRKNICPGPRPRLKALSFVDILGHGPRVKMLDFLICGRGLRYSISDISEGAEISRTTCHTEIWEMLRQHIVRKEYKKGFKRPLYIVDEDECQVRALVEFYDSCSVRILRQAWRKECAETVRRLGSKRKIVIPATRDGKRVKVSFWKKDEDLSESDIGGMYPKKMTTGRRFWKMR
jgi:hypothetical protein